MVVQPLTLDAQSSVAAFINLPVLHTIVINGRILQPHMAKSIPLRATLRVHLNDIIVGDNLILTVFIPLLEIDNGLFKSLSASDSVIEVVQSQIQLDRLPDSYFSSRCPNHVGRKKIECCSSQPAPRRKVGITYCQVHRPVPKGPKHSPEAGPPPWAENRNRGTSPWF